MHICTFPMTSETAIVLEPLSDCRSVDLPVHTAHELLRFLGARAARSRDASIHLNVFFINLTNASV